MKIINTRNMPQSYVDTITTHLNRPAPYDFKPDYRVTQLCSPPRITILKNRHKDEIVHDVFDEYYSLVGNSIHEYFLKGLEKNPKYLVEKTLKLQALDRLISGTMDLYHIDTGIIEDHKTCSLYIYGQPLKPEWVEQTNIYAYIAESLGYAVNGLQIHTIFKDWREAAGKYAYNYPSTPTQILDVPLLPLEERKALFESRLKQLIELENTPDDELPFCTSDQTWEKSASYAVYKEGAQKATKLCPTKAAAEEYIRYKGRAGVGLKIEHRQGERTRCEKYCEVAPFCNQYQLWLKERDGEVANAIIDNVKVASHLDAA